MVPGSWTESCSLECIECHKTYPWDHPDSLCSCGDLLEVNSNLTHDVQALKSLWDQRRLSRSPADRSGVFRYREMVLPLPEEFVVTRGEGNTNLYSSSQLDQFCDLTRLVLKHEGENPTGSFKDRGMATATSIGKLIGAKAVVCASTGNTSASMASFAAIAGMKAVVLIPRGKIALGKLSQSLAYGALTLEVEGDFDQALEMVREASYEKGIYLMNSVNPYRIEGQKSILIEALDDLRWELPDWIVLPGGNLGNTSAIGKALRELYKAGFISKMPRVAVIQARGANPFYQMIQAGSISLKPMAANTMATAIQIGNPVSWKKAQRIIKETNGVVEELSEEEIRGAKEAVDRAGIGAEPASCCTVGGIQKLVSKGVISKNDSVLGILTGNLLKDPQATLEIHSGDASGGGIRQVSGKQELFQALDEIL
jgi:threonine synthase